MIKNFPLLILTFKDFSKDFMLLTEFIDFIFLGPNF